MSQVPQMLDAQQDLVNRLNQIKNNLRKLAVDKRQDADAIFGNILEIIYSYTPNLSPDVGVADNDDANADDSFLALSSVENMCGEVTPSDRDSSHMDLICLSEKESFSSALTETGNSSLCKNETEASSEVDLLRANVPFETRTGETVHAVTDVHSKVHTEVAHQVETATEIQTIQSENVDSSPAKAIHNFTTTVKQAKAQVEVPPPPPIKELHGPGPGSYSKLIFTDDKANGMLIFRRKFSITQILIFAESFKQSCSLDYLPFAAQIRNLFSAGGSCGIRSIELMTYRQEHRSATDSKRRLRTVELMKTNTVIIIKYQFPSKT